MERTLFLDIALATTLRSELNVLTESRPSCHLLLRMFACSLRPPIIVVDADVLFCVVSFTNRTPLFAEPSS